MTNHYRTIIWKPYQQAGLDENLLGGTTHFHERVVKCYETGISKELKKWLKTNLFMFFIEKPQ